MKIVLLGAPGSGKGTRAKIISETYGIPHISTGDLFRANMANDTPLGKQVKSYMEKGMLCPDEITVSMVEERLKEDDCKNGYLLDGFPRNLFQAQKLDEISAPDKVINVEVSLDILKNRIVGRRVCSSCHNIFHVDVVGQCKLCPDCGGELIHRKDDTPEIVEKRIQIYQKESAPLIDYYGKEGKLASLNGELPFDKIVDAVKKVL